MGRSAAIFGVWAVALVPASLGATGFSGFQRADKPATGVRPIDGASGKLLQEGLRRSVTISELAAEAEASDIRASVEISYEPGIPRAETHFVSAVAGLRMLRVIVNGTLGKDERLAALGHELQHVREIAQALDVISAATMRRLFERVGYPASPGSNNYETSAAQSVERQIRFELARNR